MRKILYILVLLVSVQGFGQSFRFGSPNASAHLQGSVIVDSSIILPDTLRSAGVGAFGKKGSTVFIKTVSGWKPVADSATKSTVDSLVNKSINISEANLHPNYVLAITDSATHQYGLVPQAGGFTPPGTSSQVLLGDGTTAAKDLGTFSNSPNYLRSIHDSLITYKIYTDSSQFQVWTGTFGDTLHAKPWSATSGGMPNANDYLRLDTVTKKRIAGGSVSGTNLNLLTADGSTVTITGLPSGGSSTITRLVPDSAYKDPNNPTIQETIKWQSLNYSSDVTANYVHYPAKIKPIEIREVVRNRPWYNAFIVFCRSDSTGTLVALYHQGSGHALNSAPAWIRSIDGGKTWSPIKLLVPRTDGCDYKVGASTFRKSDGAVITTYENGPGNTIGLPLDTFHIAYSFNDGISFDSLRAVGVTTWFHWMTTQTERITEMGSVQLMCVFGDTTLNGPLKGGVLRTSDWFGTKTFVPWPGQTSLAAKNLNESTLIPKGDSLFAFIRAESGSYNYYRTYSLDTGLTWATLVPVNINSYRSRPDITLLPDGSMIWFSRINADLYRGGIWVSVDNGLNWTFKGEMYPQNTTFLYASSVIRGSTLLTLYSVENSQIPFSGGSAGIYVATFPTNPAAVITKDAARTTMVLPTSNPVGIAQNWKGLEDDGSGTLRTTKAVIIGSDSTVTDDDFVKGMIGGDLKGPTGQSIIPGVGDFTNSGLQGARPMAHNIAHKDSLTEPHHYLAATKAGYKIYAVNAVGSDSALVYDPIRGTRQYLSLANSDHEGAATVGDTVYTIPIGAATLEKIDSRTNLVSTHTLPSAGWAGPNYANGSLWASKPGGAGDTHLLRHYVVGDSDVLINLPFSFSGYPGPFDGRYQWFIGYFSNFWLKVDVNTNEVIVIGKGLTLNYINGVRNRAIYNGRVIVANNLTSNHIFFLNPANLATKEVVLPSGSYPTIWTDDVSIYAGGGTGPLCKIDPNTLEYWVVSSTGGYGAGVTFGTRNILLPNGSGKIYSFETIEKGSDPIASTVGYVKMPVDSLVVGDAVNHLTIKNINTAGATSYANGGTGDRTGTMTATTDLTMGGTGGITRLINGDLTTNSTWIVNQNVAGKNITFDLGSARVLTEMRFIQQDASTHGTWQGQASPDGSSWVNIGSTFTLGGASTQLITTFGSNTTADRYYRLLGVVGSGNPGPYVYQMEFKLSAGGSLPAYADVQGTSDIHLQDSGSHVIVPTELTTDSSNRAASTKYVKQIVGSLTGEANTASNIAATVNPNYAGFSGTKSGVNLPFRSLSTPNDAGVQITGMTNEVEIKDNAYDIKGRNTVSTTNATVTMAKHFVLQNGSAGIITVEISCMHSDGASAYTIIKQISFAKAASGGTLTLGSEITQKAGELIPTSSNPLSGVSTGFAISANDAEIRVTGLAATTMYWNVTYKVDYVFPNL